MDGFFEDKKGFTDRLLTQLRHRIAVTGESETKFAARMGSSDALFKNLKTGSLPSAERLHYLLHELGQSLTLGVQPPTPSFAPIILDSKDYALVPLHVATLSAGSGSINGDNAIIDHLAFRINWLRKLGVAPDQACLARAEGNSMLPTIHPGDMVLIDTARTEPPVYRRRENDQRRTAIYAFVEAGQARLKRIERPASDVLFLVSDNPNHAPELRTGPQLEQLQTSIIGKVVWWGHTAPDR